MTSPASERLSRLFDVLLRGDDPSAVDIALLSSLEGEDLEFAASRWPELSTGARERLLQRANELAEDDVGLDFVALARLAMRDNEPGVRRRGVETLWETEDRRVADELVAVLERDNDAAVREAAGDSLMHFVILAEFEEIDPGTGDRVVAALRGRVEDVREEIGVRAAALEALGPRSEIWVDSLITNAFYHDTPRMRIAAFRAMAASAHEKWLEYIYEGLTSEEAEARFEAAQAAGSIASEEATDSVAVLLDDEDSEVALAAIRALGEISGDDALRYLREFAERAPDAYQEELAVALDSAVFNLSTRDDDDEDWFE